MTIKKMKERKKKLYILIFNHLKTHFQMNVKFIYDQKHIKVFLLWASQYSSLSLTQKENCCDGIFKKRNEDIQATNNDVSIPLFFKFPFPHSSVLIIFYYFTLQFTISKCPTLTFMKIRSRQ